MPVLKKCYYDVLGIERDGTDEDIKKSFRKLALQLHPDKNLDRHEEAKEEFQILQQAYEVLSNPQERAWYDEHRHAILRGGLKGDFEDDSIDIMAYCSSTCYKGFGDDDEAFYAVYRNVFAKLAAEEIEAGLEDSDEEIPSFGDVMSAYEEDVGPFYAYWESFCTRKNFAWHDEYDTRHAACRRVSRLMDKENKKLRTEAKKDWNQRVRAFVDFVKRKDKRVQAWKAEQELRLKEKEALLAKRCADEKVKRQQERKKILESVKKGHAHGGHDKEQLKEMEAWMADEFGEPQELESDDEEDCLYCEVCNKSFRTDKAFMNHEKSKKHLRQVQILREQMEEEDEEFEEQADHEVALEDDLSEDGEDKGEDQLDQDIDDHPGSTATETVSQLGSQPTDEPIQLAEDEEEMLQNFVKLKLRKTGSADLEGDVESEHENNIHAGGSSLKSNRGCSPEKADQTKKKRRRAPKDKEQKRGNGDHAQDCDSDTGRTKLQPHGRDDNPPLPALPTCTGCRKPFDNKNQLFKHLKQYPDHAALKGLHSTRGTMDSIGSSGTGKGKKGKNKR